MSLVRDDPRSGSISCLCVTENRPAFVPWLLWCFERQTWPDKELVIVDSSEPALTIPTHPSVRVVRAANGTRVAEKRNVALDQARGEFLAWFDDDDWQHPERLARCVAAFDAGTVCAGASASWFLDVLGRRCARYTAESGLIFNGALFRTAAVRPIRFDVGRLRASDTGWMRAVVERYPNAVRRVPDFVPFFWLCHARNLSNPQHRVRFDRPADEIEAAIGAAAWGDTGAELDHLRERLGRVVAQPSERLSDVPTSMPRIIGNWSRRGPGVSWTRANAASVEHGIAAAYEPGPAAELPRKSIEPTPVPVSVLVKATILDAPYLAVLVPHMLAQAGVAFSERVIVVDPRPEFSGKYQSRPRGTRHELDAVLSRLLGRNVIDRVIDVPSNRDEVAAVMTKYFGAEGERMPTHAVTGGPIFATLFGLEAVSTDHVLAMDADMFFHAAGISWVQEGLQLFDDPTTWLVMTHGGPPAGALGTQQGLGQRNAVRAHWDPRRRVFRFETASTRYFLADRRRLRGKLPVLWQGPDVLPLEQCISAGLQQHGAARLCLERDGSWDLHAHYHGAPFPEWAPRIAELVERGTVPRLQRGNYDLRLDSASSRVAWKALLEAAPANPAVSVSRDRAADGSEPAHRVEAGEAALSLAVVIAVRDRAGPRVSHALASVAWQTPCKPAEVVVVSLGSRAEIDSELQTLCRRWGARFLAHGVPAEPWCKPLALNIGIRRTDEARRFVMTMDADMILAPNFLDAVHSELSGDPLSFVLCQSADLPRLAMLPSSPEALLEALPRLRRHARLRGVQGSGGIQAASRDFFFDVRGYDEDLKWWGAEDGDMLERAKTAGRTVRWINDRTFMLHQWHPKRHSILTDQMQRSAARDAWDLNHRLARERREVRRNPEHWGGER